MLTEQDIEHLEAWLLHPKTRLALEVGAVRRRLTARRAFTWLGPSRDNVVEFEYYPDEPVVKIHVNLSLQTRGHVVGSGVCSNAALCSMLGRVEVAYSTRVCESVMETVRGQ